MSAPAWGRSRPSASPSESSASAGRASASRRPASSSNGLDSSASRTAAGVRRAARRLRLGLLSALLCLPLLAGLAAPAAAQTPTANADGSYTVPQNWALKPSAIAAGTKFRLLFLTEARNATPTDIATYNSFVQNEAANGRAAIRPYSSRFRMVGSTATVDARDNTMTTGTGVPIYWLNGAKVADDYNDFWDGSWDAQMASDTRDENGNTVAGSKHWTGTQTGGSNGGTKHSTEYLGATNVRQGQWGTGTNPINQMAAPSGDIRRTLGLSPVFVVGTPLELVSVSRERLRVQENGEGTYTVVLKSAPSGNVVISATSGATATATVWPGALLFSPSGANAWNIPKTFSVTGEGAGSTTISHAVQSSADTTNYPTSMTIPPVSVTVVTPQPRVEVSLIWTETIPPRPQKAVVGGASGREVAKKVKETDSGTTDVHFYVRTERLHSSKLPFRVCLSGNATQDTTGNPQPEVEDDYQVVVDGAVQGSCFDTSIPANTRYKRMTIRILNEDRLDNARGDTEQVILTLSQAPGNPLPYPWEVASESGYWKLSLGIIDDDFFQQPVQFSPAEYEIIDKQSVVPRSQTRRASERYSGGEGVGVMFTKGVPYTPYTVTYKVVHAESTATYGDDYTLAGYNRNTDRGTIRVPGPSQRRGGAALWVNVVDDSLVEGEEQFVIEMVDVSDSLWVNREDDRHKLSIAIDDNDNPAYLRVNPEQTTLSGDGAEQRITMSAGVPLPVDVHFEYCVEQGTATLGTDYELTGPDGGKVAGTGCHLATLPAGSAGIDLVVRMLDGDDRSEPDEQVKIRLQKSTRPGKETASSTVEIKILPSTVEQDQNGNEVNMAAIVTLKDDDMPTLEVAGQRGAGGNGGLIKFTVRAVNGPFDKNLDLHWELDDPGNLINGDTKTVTRTRECTQFLRDLGFCTGNTHTYTTESPVHRKKSGVASLARGKTKVDLTFLVRDSGPDGSVTFTASEKPSYRLVSGKGSACVAIRGGACSGGQGGSSDDQVVVVAPPRPTAAVANVQVTAVDATSATVTWDAVAHATSYRVEYAGTASDPQNNVQGSVDGHTDTTWTFDHSAAEAMTVTVTVTPEYVDGNGDTQRLADLAGTATIDVAPAGTQDTQDTVQAHSCDLTSVKASVAGYVGETHYGNAHVARWKRALAGLNEEAGGMTAAQARQMMAAYSTSRWQPVVDALDCLEEAAAAQPETPAAVPEIAVSGGSAITEGASASFTVTATPAPSANLVVTLTVDDDAASDFLAQGNEGTQTVTIQAGQSSATLTLATENDTTDEPDGRVSATVVNGTGYTVGSPNTASVAVRDDDDPPVATPVVRLASGSDITEGGTASFTLTATPAPTGTLAVRVDVTDSGSFAASGQTGTQTVTIGTTGTATLTVATTDDALNEADGRIAATIRTGTGYTVADPPDDTAAVTVADDDDPVVRLAGGSGVTEGTPAAFTLTATPAPHADLTVNLAVTQSGDYAAAGQTGTREVTIPTGGSVTVEVATVNDTTDEPNGSVTATLAAGTGYTVAASPDDTASVAVADDDAAAGGPTLSVNDVEVKEGPYRRVTFTVTLSTASDRYVSFYYRVRESSPVSAKRGVDFWTSTGKTFAGIRPGQTEARIMAGMVIDDSHDEDPETFEIVLSDAHDAVIADGVGIATIVNSDPMPQAWLGRMGRTLAQQALDGITGRLTAPRTPGAQGTLAGQAFSLRPGGTETPTADSTTPAPSVLERLAALVLPGLAAGGAGGTGANPAFGGVDPAFGGGIGDGDAGVPGVRGTGDLAPQTFTLRDALLGSSFTATGQPDAWGGSVALWGRAALATFDGQEGTFALDGEVLTGLLGVDYARDRWLLGVSLLQSASTGGYLDRNTGAPPCPAHDLSAEMRQLVCNGAVRAGDGKVEATMTAAVPYAAFQASERLNLWGAAGYGAGELTLTPETGDALTTDLDWTMAQLGVRGTVLAPVANDDSGLAGGPALAVTSDALWARTTSEKIQDGLAASESDVTRLRLGLEGSWLMTLEDLGQVTPKLAVGARHDGGDAETGFGVELGGGLAWAMPTAGLALNVEGRTLLTHREEAFRDQGVAASFVFDPDPATPRGPSVSLRQDWGGSATGGVEALFAANPLAQRQGTTATRRWAADMAWGFPAFGGAFTSSPLVGLGLAQGSRDYRLGWRLVPATATSAFALEVQATRREPDAAVPEHRLGLELSTRW